MNHIQQHNHETKPDLSICQKNSTERAMMLIGNILFIFDDPYSKTWLNQRWKLKIYISSFLLNIPLKGVTTKDYTLKFPWGENYGSPCKPHYKNKLPKFLDIHSNKFAKTEFYCKLLYMIRKKYEIFSHLCFQNQKEMVKLSRDLGSDLISFQIRRL